MRRFTAPALIAALGLAGSSTAVLAQTAGQTAGQTTGPSGAQAAETHSGSTASTRRTPARGPGSSTEMKTNGNPGVTPSGPYTSTEPVGDTGGLSGSNSAEASSPSVPSQPSQRPPNGSAPDIGAGAADAPNAEGGPH